MWSVLERNNNRTLRRKKKVLNQTWYSPDPSNSWHWQLTGTINTEIDVDIYGIDLVESSEALIDELHSKNKKVICYFSAGSWENYRDDAQQFPDEVLGEQLDGWPDEKWLDISKYKQFSHIMENRLDLAKRKNCDAVEPDNIDAYQNKTGLDISYADQLTYNKWLAEQAHQRGLGIALKNDLEQVKDLVNHFDFAINEQCFQYQECDLLEPFIKQGKAVFGVEYELEKSEFCSKARDMNFRWLKMDYDLDGDRDSCDD